MYSSGLWVFVIVGVAMIFYPPTCTCGTCQKGQTLRIILGLALVAWSVKGLNSDADDDGEEETEQSVLRICPHCSNKTLRSKTLCFACGRELPIEVPSTAAPKAVRHKRKVEHSSSEEARPSVLRACPHCGSKTLRSRPCCVSCGKRVDFEA